VKIKIFEWRTFDAQEDGDVSGTETVCERAHVVELVASLHALHIQRTVSQRHVVRAHHVTQSGHVPLPVTTSCDVILES